MPTYAIKIGEVFLQSGKSITEEERKQAIRELREAHPGGFVFTLGDGLEVVSRPQGPF